MNSTKLQAYREMIADQVRMAAYADALRALAPGKAVCEIGVGLGPLSLMALQSGARVVYGIEIDGDALAIATRVIRAAGFGPDQFIPVQGLSTQVSLPEKVDVIVSETLDSTGIGENTVRFLDDARARFLRPDGQIIPARMTGLVALATSKVWRDEEQWWETAPLGGPELNFAPAISLLRGRFHIVEVKTEELRSSWVPWANFNFNTDLKIPSMVPTLIPVLRTAQVTGLAWAFTATLSEGVLLSTRSDAPLTHWKQGFWPLPKPLMAEAKDAVYVELHVDSKASAFARISLRVIHVKRDQREAFLEKLRSSIQAGHPPT